ncbi:MAG: FtsX-like permease family protein [Alphaproteobacteria bacterium]|nr:FtsX-like permease family protein [Alphaproteobacteria bacterium]
MFSELRITLLSFLKNKHVKALLHALGFLDRDLPLHKSADTQFLMILIGLMSFLAVMAFSGMFALNNITNRWSSGLENKVTIEIAVETEDGHFLSENTVQHEVDKIVASLKGHPDIASLHVLTQNEIQELISPWIGDNLTLTDIPLPGLIALELANSEEQTLLKLKHRITSTSEYANLETHREWLGDIIGFASTLKMVALLVACIVTAITVIAIMTGMRTRFALHYKEVDLLHAIGASDLYIARQFQRHAMVLALQGGFLGTIAGIIVMMFIVFLSSNSNTSLIPEINIGFTSYLSILMIPVFLAGIAAFASRWTTMRNLLKMP